MHKISPVDTDLSTPNPKNPIPTNLHILKELLTIELWAVEAIFWEEDANCEAVDASSVAKFASVKAEAEAFEAADAPPVIQ